MLVVLTPRSLESTRVRHWVGLDVLGLLDAEIQGENQLSPKKTPKIVYFLIQNHRKWIGFIPNDEEFPPDS
jgi:hypothetical protein